MPMVTFKINIANTLEVKIVQRDTNYKEFQYAFKDS